MSFNIQQIYQNSQFPQPRKFFLGKLDSISFKDNYHNLWVTGKYLIRSNSVLPAYSYYLDIDSEFGYVQNIPLFFEKTWQKYYRPDSATIAFTEDLYSFSFSLNISQSSAFSENIKYKMIDFHISPMFNQNVIADFDVATNTTDIQKFVIDVNNSRETYQKEYINQYHLAPGLHSLPISMMDDPKIKPVELIVTQFNQRRIFDLFLSTSYLGKAYNVLSSKVVLTPLDGKYTPLEINIDDYVSKYNGLIFGFNRYITYDAQKQMLISEYQPHMSGIFINENLTINFNARIKFVYENAIRTIIINENLWFNPAQMSHELKLITFEQSKNITLENIYEEVESEKISK